MFFRFGSKKNTKGNTAAKSNKQRGGARRFQPLVETLEARLNLAGNVVASFSGGNLTLTGDNQANELRIVGGGSGVFSVSGVGTSLGGVFEGVRDFSNVWNITINFKNGDDVATFITAELPGVLNYTGGNGNDQLLFGEGNGEDQSFGALVANMGAGNDSIEVNGESDFTIAGVVSVYGGDGNNTLDLDPDDSLTLGAVTVVNGKGNDFVDIGDTVVNAVSIVINNGNGDNDFFLDGDVTIQGSVVVTGGTGPDNVEPGDGGGDTLIVGGSMVFNLGNGTNFTEFSQVNTSIGGGITYTGGTGSDTFDIDGEQINVRGSVSLATGNGADIILLNEGATNIAGSLVVDTAAGADELTFFGLTVIGTTVVKTGEGSDSVTVDNSTFRGAVTLLTAGGIDTVSIEAGDQDDGVGTVFEQDLVVNLGAGNDTLNVGFDDDDFVTTLKKVVVDGAAGADTLNSSGTNLATFQPILVSIT